MATGKYRILKFTPSDGGMVVPPLIDLGLMSVNIDLGNGYTGTVTFPTAALNNCPMTFEKMI